MSTRIRDSTVHRSGPAPLLIGITAGLGALVFVLLRVLVHDADVTTLIRIGEDLPPAGVDRPDDLATVDGIGYDGQYYYRQALDPLSTEQPVDGIALDRPAYRSARIGYPAVVWVVSLGGQRDLVPWMLAAVNIGLVGLLGSLGALFARDAQRSTWWGLLFAGWPGFVIALSYDLAEPLEAALVLIGVYCLRCDRGLIAALALSGAALTRESALVVPLAILAVALLRLVRRWVPEFVGLDDRPNHLIAALAPIATYGAMQVWMSDRWSEAAEGGIKQSAEHVGSIPLSGLASQMIDWVKTGDVVDLFQLLQVLLILLVYACLVAALLRSRHAGTAVERVGFVGATALVSMLGGWDRMVVYLRWQDIAMMLGFVVFLEATSPAPEAWSSPRHVVMALGLLAASTAPIWVVI